MNNRKTLTKSLHTVTAVTNVARILKAAQPSIADPVVLTYAAMNALQLRQKDGKAWPQEDPTVAACIAAVTAKVLS